MRSRGIISELHPLLTRSCITTSRLPLSRLFTTKHPIDSSHNCQIPVQPHSSRRNLTIPPSKPPHRPCPSCQTPLPLSTTPCPNCLDLISIPSNLSHYSLLNLSTPIVSNAAFSSDLDIPQELSLLPAYGFDLDVRDIRRRMLDRQKDLHPDKYQGRGEGLMELAKDLSGRVNLAYEVLADPLRRAEYILSQHELATIETDSLSDPGLLAEILQAREELDEAETPEQVETIRKANHKKVEATISNLKEAFSEVPPNFAAAKILAVQLKYWKGLEEAAREWRPRVVAL